jgi:hypothetical protein
LLLAIQIKGSDIQGLAYVTYAGNITQPISVWVEQGSTRFYFKQKYDAKTNTMEKVPASAQEIRGAIEPQVC